MISGAETHLPRYFPKAFDAAVRAFEFDDPAFVERTEFGFQWWDTFEQTIALAVKTRRVMTGDLQERVLDQGEVEYYQKLLGELRGRRALFWEHDAGVHQSILSIPIGGHGFVQMAVASKGNHQTASRGILLIPGFGPDNRTFESTFSRYRLEENEAMLAASVMGAGSVVPKEIGELSPKILTDLYVRATLASFPQAKEITLVGNSMGAAIAMAVAVRLGAEHGKKVHVVIDNTIGTNVLSDMKPWLLQAARPIKWWEGGLNGALWMVTHIPFTRESLIDDWYGSTDGDPTEADLFYNATLFSLPTPEGAYSVAGLLAAMGTHLDEWPEYYADVGKQHGEWMTMNASGEMTRFDLHGGTAVFVDSIGNHFFPQTTTDRVYRPTLSAQPDRTRLIRTPDAHVPRRESSRLVDALEWIRIQQNQ